MSKNMSSLFMNDPEVFLLLFFATVSDSSWGAKILMRGKLTNL